MTYRIFSNGFLVNTIVADEAFVKNYCMYHVYTYEEVSDAEPEQTPDVWDELAAAIREGVNDV